MKDYITFLSPSPLKDSIGFKVGWGNGYVCLPEGHPYYGKAYDNIPVDVHGGLTFGEEMALFGKKYFVVGFDTAHLNDTKATCPLSYVAEQTENLRLQLEELANEPQNTKTKET